MNKIKLALLILIFTLGGLSTVQSQKVINAKDFGLEEGKDATQAIWRAIEKCKQTQATQLMIPQGTYHFYPTLAFEKYLAISNHDNGMKRIAFPIIAMNNLTIDGGNSEFIFHDYMVPILIEDSENISFKNFSIDWADPFHLQGQVIKVDPDNNSFQLKISAENKYEVVGEELRFTVFGKKYNLVQNLWFDPNTKATVYDVSSYKIDPWNPDNRLVYKARDLGNHVVEIQHSVAKLPEEGWIFVVKGRTADNRSRYSPGIHINRSSTISFDSINLYHAGGMGLIGEKSQNISMTNFNVLLNPQRNRIISTTADATHFVNCKGFISFDNCLFENMLDDATNVHGVYLDIKKKMNKHSLLLKTRHFQQYGFEFAQKGDTIRLIGRQSLAPKQTLVVKDIHVFNEEFQQIEFNQELDAAIETDDLAENLTWSASVSMNNCKVWRNRARGIIIKAPRPIKVENSYFSSMMSAIAIGSAGGGGWGESGPVTDVTIRNNHFKNNCTGSPGDPIILIAPSIKKQEPAFYFNSNIIIETNTIETFTKHILFARSVQNLSFINNQLFLTNDFAPWPSTKSGIEIENSRNVKIQGNKYMGNSEVQIKLDEKTSKTSTIKYNQGFLYDH